MYSFVKEVVLLVIIGFPAIIICPNVTVFSERSKDSNSRISSLFCPKQISNQSQLGSLVFDMATLVMERHEDRTKTITRESIVSETTTFVTKPHLFH